MRDVSPHLHELRDENKQEKIGELYAVNKLYQIPPQHFSSHLKLLDEELNVAIPESSYRAAPMNPVDLQYGLAKYSFDPKIRTLRTYYEALLSCWNSTTDSYIPLEMFPYEHFTVHFTSFFTTFFPNIHAYAQDMCPLPNDQVLFYADHDLNGTKRDPTSAGIGFNLTRNELVDENHPQNIRKDIIEFLNQSYLPPVYGKMFLKDELRDKTKETRSIAVPQVTLWFYGMKYIGFLYLYFKQAMLMGNWNPIAFGLDDGEYAFTYQLRDFTLYAKTFEADLKKQDSRMNASFIDFTEMWIQQITAHRFDTEITAFFDEGYRYKKLVDAYGNVFSFEHGEMSGVVTTILMNSLESVFFYVLPQYFSRLAVACHPGRTLKLPESYAVSVLGDDVIAQHNSLYTKLYVSFVKILERDVLYENKLQFVNEATFLSWKFDYRNSKLLPYYCNVDKALGSLHYYTGNDVLNYVAKLESYKRMLCNAPANTEEEKLYDFIESVRLHFKKLGFTSNYFTRDYLLHDRFKDIWWRRIESVNNEFDNSFRQTTTKTQTK